MDNYNTASQETAVEDDWKWEEWILYADYTLWKIIQSNTTAKKRDVFGAVIWINHFYLFWTSNKLDLSHFHIQSCWFIIHKDKLYHKLYLYRCGGLPESTPLSCTVRNGWMASVVCMSRAFVCFVEVCWIFMIHGCILTECKTERWKVLAEITSYHLYEMQ